VKRYILGLLSIALLIASIFGAPSKAPKAQAPERSERDSGPALFV
jgi:hypothetical protein